MNKIKNSAPKGKDKVKKVGGGSGDKIKLFQFKITLDHSSPKVWRRILVPSNYSFFGLHTAIQGAMSGWLDYHLHGFYVAQKGTSRPISIKFPDPEGEIFEYDDYLDERKEKIADYFGVKVKQCKYCYDYGDNWDHTILFEREIGGNPKENYPKCTAGENACPPEDCGGVWGYQNLQKILKNPKHPEYKDRREWLLMDDGDAFDPTYFDIDDVYFEDPKEKLEEYEENFGVRSLMGDGDKNRKGRKREKKIISPYHDQFDSDDKKDLSSEIKRLVDMKFSRMGVWEIAQRSNKVSEMAHSLGGDKPILNVIVHRDSYFILSAGITFLGDIENFKEMFLEAIEKNKFIPEVLHTDDLKIADYLREIADAFGFEVKKEKLKAVQVILSDMTKHFS